jgi:hypothetical protein
MKAVLSLFVIMTLSTILLTSGCQKKTAATNPNPQRKTELPENTKPLQAADLVGYDGTKLRKSVQQIKDANDRRSRAMEKVIETGPDQ